MATMYFEARPDFDNRKADFVGHWGNATRTKPFFLFRVTQGEHTMYVFAEAESDAIGQATASPSPIKINNDPAATAEVVPFRIRGYSELFFGKPTGKWRDATLADLQKSGMKARFSDTPFASATDGFIDRLRGYEDGWRAVGGVSRWIYCQVWEEDVK